MRLTKTISGAVTSASLVTHAGDFTTEAVFDGFESLAAAFAAVVNPGSHADPRGRKPTFAVVERTEGDLWLSLQTTGGQTRQREFL